MPHQLQNQVSELNELFRKYFYDDNSFLKRVEAKSKAYYIDNVGIYAYAVKGDVVIEMHSMSNECPGLIINCFEVRNVSFHFTLEFKPHIEQDSFGICLYLHGQGINIIECESLSYEILDESCWGKHRND